MKLLHIDAGITGPGSVSRQLSAAVVDALTRDAPGLEVIRRDLDADPVPHLDSRNVGALRPVEDAELDPETARSVEVLNEFLAADVVVIGAPRRSRRSCRPPDLRGPRPCSGRSCRPRGCGRTRP